MDNRLREIEQWVAEARDGLGDGGQEAYVRKLYLLDAEIRAVIKDSGILPQAVSPRPALSLVRRIESWALPVASAMVVLAAATVYLRGGFAVGQDFSPARIAGLKTHATSPDSSILTARPESAQKNTPPAGPSSTPQDWHAYLAANGEVVVHFTEASEPASAPAHRLVKDAPVILASAVGAKPVSPVVVIKPTQKGEASFAPTTKEPTPTTSPMKVPSEAANESTNVAGSVILAGYSPAPQPEEQPAKPSVKKGKNKPAVKAVEEQDEAGLDLDALIAKGEETFER